MDFKLRSKLCDTKELEKSWEDISESIPDQSKVFLEHNTR